MFLTEITTYKLIQSFHFLAQVIVEPEPEAVEDAAMMFSGPQFFTALVAGVVLAFAFQLLFTNLGVATGISLLGGSSSNNNSHSSSSGGGLRKIGLALGLGTLISVAISLFFASLFAVKLSLLVSAGSGAIVGLVIWGTYFTLLVWISSTTVGSLIGSVVNTATSGFQALFGTAMAALSSKAASDQVVATAEAAASAVRRELTGTFDPVSLREQVEDYIDTIRPPQLDIKEIRTEFENILSDPSLRDAATSGSLPNLDRQTFVDLVSSRTDLSERETNRIAKQLEAAWNQTAYQLPQRDSWSEFVDYLKSASRTQLLGEEFSQKLDTLTDELRSRRQSQNSQGSNPLTHAFTGGLNSIMGLVMGRTDLSDLDVEKIVNQLQKSQDKLVEQKDKIVDKFSAQSNYSLVRTDIENYLINAQPWQLTVKNLEREFRHVLYDQNADPAIVAEELDQINRSDFVDGLQQKGMLTQAKIQKLANILDGIRLEALATAQAAKEREEAIILLAEVEQYLLKAPKSDLTPEKIRLNFKPILQDSDASTEQLSTRLSQFDRLMFERVLEQRSDLTPVEISVITKDLETARNQVLQESREMSAAVQAKAEAQWLKLKSYLRDTGKSELNPDMIERELKLLSDDPQAGMSALRTRAAQFDRDTLVQLLTQRNDLSEQQVNQVIDQVERIWTRVRYQPQQLAGKAKLQYEQAKSSLANYLRNTGKPELNPEGIERDLKKLFDDPKTGSQAIRRRLAQIDRDTLVKLLAQRDDLNEAQVNQMIDEVQQTLRELAKSPRRIAQRTQEKVQDFQTVMADYLRSTEKEELNPEGIQRDVQLLLNDPRLGMESLKQRLSQFDRSTLVALLSQRDDISEEEVNRIVEQILDVRDQVIEQFQKIQFQVQSAIDQIFAKIRNYLNSLDRPELSYDGIRRDIRKLFDDPQVGFEALRYRLSKFDRDTFVALLSSRDDISEADANQIIDQMELTRNRVLQKAERLQREAELRLEQVKQQTQKQVEETRKAASVAAWWLFFTALISGIAAASAGAIGVTI